MVMHKSDFDDSDRAKALRRVTALGQVETISQISPTSQRTKVAKTTATATSAKSANSTLAPKSATSQAKTARNQAEPKHRTPGPADFGRPVKRQESQPEVASRIIQHFADRHPAAHATPKATVPTPPTPSPATKVASLPTAATLDAKSPAEPAAISDSFLDAALDAAFNATVNPHANSPAELRSNSADDSQSVPTKLPKALPKFSFKAFKSRLSKFQSSKGRALKSQLSKLQSKKDRLLMPQLSKLQSGKDKLPAPQLSKLQDDKGKLPATQPSKLQSGKDRAAKPSSKSIRRFKKFNIKDLDVDTTSTVAQRFVLSIIGILVLIVSGGVIALLNYDTKTQLESKIGDLAKTYYEDYFYPNIFSGNISIADVLAEFGESGLTEVSLRQLILTNPELSTSEIHFLRQHCDQEKTTVRYYPTDPYDRTSYRTEFKYSCNFDDNLISV